MGRVCLGKAAPLLTPLPPVPQHIAVLLKVKLLSCEDAQLAESSVVSLFLNYNNKKLRVNINVPLKSEQRVEQVRACVGISAVYSLIAGRLCVTFLYRQMTCFDLN